MTGAITVGADHIIVAVRLTPNARNEGIDGLRLLDDGQQVLAVRVRAVPEDGAANAALEALLAKTAGVPRSHVRVIAGQTHRRKRVRLEGPGAALAARLTG